MKSQDILLLAKLLCHEFYTSNRQNHFFVIVSENEYKTFSKNIMQDYTRNQQLLAAAKYNL